MRQTLVNYETGEGMMEMRDGGHYTLAEVLQLPGYQDRSSIYFGTTPMWRKAEVRAWLAARPRGRKSRRRGPGAKVGALLDLGLLLAFGLVDHAVAQQPPTQSSQQPYYQVPNVRIVPQTPPSIRVPQPAQITPRSPNPVPMYPQYEYTKPARRIE
jgi:hypothetical protein